MQSTALSLPFFIARKTPLSGARTDAHQRATMGLYVFID